MRSEAETANVRARARREVDDTRQYAVQKFATDVVEAAENLRRGIDSLPPPRAGRAGDRRSRCARASQGVERSFIGVLERNGIKQRGPGRPAVRPQPAPGDGRAGQRGAPARHRHAGLDPGLDPERPAAAAGHGGGGQGAHRRTARRPAAELDTTGVTLTQSGTRPGMNDLSQNLAIRPCPRRLGPIHPVSYHPMGTRAVLRAAAVR